MSYSDDEIRLVDQRLAGTKSVCGSLNSLGLFLRRCDWLDQTKTVDGLSGTVQQPAVEPEIPRFVWCRKCCYAPSTG